MKTILRAVRLTPVLAGLAAVAVGPVTGTIPAEHGNSRGRRFSRYIAGKLR